tara:strand:- start:7944 stop:9443 length:1500 start_codon:yes stop_codon:yes gene_type:complete
MKTLIVNKKNKNSFYGCTLTYGHFSTIHPGHIRYLSNAKKKSGKLVIGLIGDHISSKSVFFRHTQKERANALKILNIADGIFLLNENFLSEAINLLNPSNLILGNEFKNSNEDEITKAIGLIKRKNGEIYYDAGDITYTSSFLLEETEKLVKDKRISSFRESLDQQLINKSDLLLALDKFAKGKVLVLGDTIIDQYIDSEPLGISAEAPVIVVKEINKKNFVGGAAIVASHIKSLGSICNYISITGNDYPCEFLEKNLKNQKIEFSLIKDNKRPTTLKKRYLVDNQKIFRVSKLENKFIEKETEDKIIKLIKNKSKELDVIVFSDFNYGVITPRIIGEISKIALENNIKLLGDVQCSSQIGYITKLRNFDLICANEKEARIALNDNFSGLETICKKLITETKAKNLIIKLGSKGFILYYSKNKNDINSQPFPALSAHPVDVAGAGDSLLATMACGISSGIPLVTTAALSCCVSCLSVERMGNVPVSSNEVKNTLNNLDI